MPRQPQGARTPYVGVLLCLLSSSVLLTACVKNIAYQPDTSLLQQMSRQAAQTYMHDVLLRSVTPQIYEVMVSDEWLHYRIHPTPVVTRLPFGKIQYVEIFDNNVVFVRAYGGPLLAQLFFASPEDAMAFADLLMSFRAAYLAQRHNHYKALSATF